MTEGAEAESTVTSDVAALCHEVGAQDFFVFRRVSPHRFAHVGGGGWGGIWAGVIEASVDDEPLIRRSLATGSVIRDDGPEQRRAVGPYYAATVALVPLSTDIVVVFGHRTGSATLADQPDAVLLAAAAELDRATTVVSPAKLLADELELLEAVHAVNRSLNPSVHETLQAVANVATEALSCEIGIAVTGKGRIAVAEFGWPLPVDHAALSAMLLSEIDVSAGPVCVQDALERPLPTPLAPVNGIRSYYAVPLPLPVGGMLVVLHTDANPRGFSQLCLRIGQRVTDAMALVLETALTREYLQAALDRTASQARHDPLTGVANRLAWDEAIAGEQRRVDHGEPAVVVMCDVDNLKRTNDELGHAAGDRLLIAVARSLERCTRSHLDLVVRLSGDEFAMLLPGLVEVDAGRLLKRLRAELDRTATRDGLTAGASFGACACGPFGSVAAACAEADRRMYEEKRRHSSRI